MFILSIIFSLFFFFYVFFGKILFRKIVFTSSISFISYVTGFPIKKIFSFFKILNNQYYFKVYFNKIKIFIFNNKFFKLIQPWLVYSGTFSLALKHLNCTNSKAENDSMSDDSSEDNSPEVEEPHDLESLIKFLTNRSDEEKKGPLPVKYFFGPNKIISLSKFLKEVDAATLMYAGFEYKYPHPHTIWSAKILNRDVIRLEKLQKYKYLKKLFREETDLEVEISSDDSIVGSDMDSDEEYREIARTYKDSDIHR